MIWLALQSWNDRVAVGVGQSPFSFRHGVIVHPLNPKLGSWLSPGASLRQRLGPLEIQLVLVTAGFAVIQLLFSYDVVLQRCVVAKGVAKITLAHAINDPDDCGDRHLGAFLIRYSVLLIRPITSSFPIAPRYLKLNVNLISSMRDTSRSLVASCV